MPTACLLQVKALDAEAVEAQPHKGALEAGDEMRGLLEGSRQVNGKKAGVGSLAAVNSAPQVRLMLVCAAGVCTTGRTGTTAVQPASRAVWRFGSIAPGAAAG